MSSPEKLRETAAKLRKVASDLQILKAQKAQEKREKCAAVIVATVGLAELQKQLSEGRR